MYRHSHWVEDEEEDRTARRQTGGLAGLAVVLLLVVGGLFLVQQLRTASTIQDCLLAGRTNCDELVSAPH